MPEDWHRVAFGDMVDFPSKRYPATAPRIPYLSFKGLLESGHLVIEDGRSDGIEALPGDTVISRQGHVAGWIGKKSSLRIPAPIVAASTLMVLRPRRGLDGDFLSLLASWGQFRASVLQAHGEKTSASKEVMSALQVCIPPEIEQRRIVHLVGSIDSYIDSLRTQIEVTRAARSALLAELLAKPGDDWQESTLGDAAVVEMGQSPPGDTYNSNGDGLPFLQGSAEFGDRFPSPDRWCSAPTRVAEPGDLLVSVRAPVGDTNFADTRLAIGRGLARVRSSSVASAEFLRLVIQVEVGRLNQVAGGGMFASITAKNLRGLSVALPPIQEQRRIVDLIGSIDEQVALLVTQANSAQLFRGSAMSELLSGERLLDESYDMAVSP